MTTLPWEISEFFRDHHVMSIATSAARDIWCASVFYHFDAENRRLLFLTSTDTRHGRLLSADSLVAGTVASQPVEIAAIRGIQFSGKAQQLQGPAQQAALSAYLQCFPFAQGFQAPIWAIAIDHAKLTDNSRSFGQKLSWTAPEEAQPDMERTCRK